MDKQKLIEYINKGKSISQIAQEESKSKTTVRYWLKKHSLKTKFFKVERDNLVIKLKETVKNSLSLSEVCRKLDKPTGGNGYQNLKLLIKEYNIDISHFRTQYYMKSTVKLTADEILVYNRNKGRRESTDILKRALLEKQINLNKCSVCNISDTWQDKKLVLQIDHIDGDRLNNVLNNLRIICPNCHSQTETYCR